VTLTHVWYLIGAFLIGVAILHARERGWARAAFWAIVAAPFLVGDQILDAAKRGSHWPAQAMGAGVLAIALLASRAAPRSTDDAADADARSASAARFGNWLFVPALVIPFVTLAIVLAGKYLPAMAALLDPAQTTLIALAIACAVGLAAALAMTRARPIRGLTEGRRLLDALGWAAVLPMMLATLGTVFARTGVGDAVAQLAGMIVPTDNPIACILTYGLGMVAFTIIMGNAFAAFPVMTAGIGLPLVVGRHGGDPAALGSIGMLTGYCGTLLTPMAANFNIVPAILLDLRDQNGVIRAQWPTAVVLLGVSLVILTLAVYR